MSILTLTIIKKRKGRNVMFTTLNLINTSLLVGFVLQTNNVV